MPILRTAVLSLYTRLTGKKYKTRPKWVERPRDGFFSPTADIRYTTIPSSLGRTVRGLWDQLTVTSEDAMANLTHRTNIMRAQFGVMFFTIFIFFTVPPTFRYWTTEWFIRPVVEHQLEKPKSNDTINVYNYSKSVDTSPLFMTKYQKKKANKQLSLCQEALSFEYWTSEHLSSELLKENPVVFLPDDEFSQIPEYHEKLKQEYKKIFEKAHTQSVEGFVTLIADVMTAALVVTLITNMGPEITIFTTLIYNLLYDLSEVRKGALLMGLSTLVVGFHSSDAWQELIRIGFDRVGMDCSPIFVEYAVCISPVIIDTLFKYWVFRYLNALVPGAVRVYHEII